MATTLGAVSAARNVASRMNVVGAGRRAGTSREGHKPSVATMKVSAQRRDGLPQLVAATPPPEDVELKRRIEELSAQLAHCKAQLAQAQVSASAEGARASSLANKLSQEEQATEKSAASEKQAHAEALDARQRLDAATAELSRLMSENTALSEAAESSTAVPTPCESCRSMQEQSAVATESYGRIADEVAELKAQLKAQVECVERQRLELVQQAEAAAAEVVGTQQATETALRSAEQLEMLQSKLEAAQAEIATAARNHDVAIVAASEALQSTEAELKAKEIEVAELAIRLQIEKEHVSDAAELNLLRDKVRRQDSLTADRERSHASAIIGLEKQLEQAERELRQRDAKTSKLEGELRQNLAKTDVVGENLWEKCQQQLESQFDDDSYEAVLLEELSEMRTRFTEKIAKLAEQCADVEREAKVKGRVSADKWAQEKESLEKRCLTLGTRCAQYEAAITRHEAKEQTSLLI